MIAAPTVAGDAPHAAHTLPSDSRRLVLLGSLSRLHHRLEAAFCSPAAVGRNAAEVRADEGSLVRVSVPPPASKAQTSAGVTAMDAESRRWVDGLQDTGARHDASLARLHALLLRAARHEANRRRGWIGSVSGPELDDLAQQAADDALMSIVGKLSDFRGASRFTTWAYKFVMFEVSGKMARHAWRDRPRTLDEAAWERLPDRLAALPERAAEQREQLSLLHRAVEQDLTHHQRQVFVAAALNDIPIDVLALQIGSNRNAIYKTLFDARRKLRASLAACGHSLQRS